MEELLASLRALSARFSDSPSDEAREMSWEIDTLIKSAPAPTYQYRHHPKWDTAWMDLDESQLEIVLKRGHAVERRQRRVLSDWEPVTEASA